MKLAEALSLRATALRRIEQLRTRIISSARYQEGEEPAEDAAALLTEVEGVIDEFETLIRQINRTNAATTIGADGGTLTDALARRDALKWRHHVLKTAADAAAGSNQQSYSRQLRSELKMLSALRVADLRAQADQVARELRELDVRIQQSNWEVELLD
jgi:predicted negative regulator of RcsB-dependent stress response